MRRDTAAALRRIDWRFLLPALDRELERIAILGAGPAVMRRAQETSLATTISTVLDGRDGGILDVVALLNGAPERFDLEQAAESLRPGGILYLEVTLPASPAALFGLRHQLGRLRQAGLTPVTVYGVRPSFETAKIFLPVQRPEILGWYMRHVHTPWSARGRIYETALTTALVPQSVRGLLFTRRLAIFAEKRTSSPGGPGVLRDPRIAETLGGVAEEAVLLTDSGNRITLLPFRPDERRPMGVLKIPKLPSFNDRTENEQRWLGEIRGSVTAELAAAIPCPLGAVTMGKITLGAESYLPGRSLERASGAYLRSSRKKIRELEAAGRWLARFHQESADANDRWDQTRIGEELGAPFSEFHRTFAPTAAEEALLSRTLTEAELLVGSGIPKVWQHRDFNAWNLLVDAGEIRVFDWEGARRGLPLCDLIHLVTHWSDMVRRHPPERRVEGFRELFLTEPPGDRVQTGARKVIRRYMEALELPPNFLPIALVYTWVELSLRRRRQQIDGGMVTSDPREGNGLLQYVACLAANYGRLYPAPPGEAVRPLASGTAS